MGWNRAGLTRPGQNPLLFEDWISPFKWIGAPKRPGPHSSHFTLAVVKTCPLNKAVHFQVRDDVQGSADPARWVEHVPLISVLGGGGGTPKTALSNKGRIASFHYWHLEKKMIIKRKLKTIAVRNHRFTCSVPAIMSHGEMHSKFPPRMSCCKFPLFLFPFLSKLQ